MCSITLGRPSVDVRYMTQIQVMRWHWLAARLFEAWLASCTNNNITHDANSAMQLQVIGSLWFIDNTCCQNYVGTIRQEDLMHTDGQPHIATSIP